MSKKTKYIPVMDCPDLSPKERDQLMDQARKIVRMTNYDRVMLVYGLLAHNARLLREVNRDRAALGIDPLVINYPEGFHGGL